MKIFNKKVHDLDAIFNGHYIEVKAFYAWHFDRLPCVIFTGEIDISGACNHINQRYQHSIQEVYQHAWRNHNEDKFLFNNTIFVLKENRMIELASDYCQLLFTPRQYEWGIQMSKGLAVFKKATEARDVRIVGFARQSEVN